MVSVRLSDETDKQLEKLCAMTRRSKSFYIKEALDRYLEDLEDQYVAMERMMRPNRQYLTSQEVLQQLGDDGV